MIFGRYCNASARAGIGFLRFPPNLQNSGLVLLLKRLNENTPFIGVFIHSLMVLSVYSFSVELPSLRAVWAELVHLMHGVVPTKFFVIAEVVVGGAVGSHGDGDAAIARHERDVERT